MKELVAFTLGFAAWVVVFFVMSSVIVNGYIAFAATVATMVVLINVYDKLAAAPNED